MASNFVKHLHCTPGGAIWIGTYNDLGGGGASRYVAEDVVNFNTKDGLVGNTVETIYGTSDGKGISGGPGGVLTVWDIRTGQDFYGFAGHSGAVTGVAVTADGKLVSSGSDRTLKVWDIDTGEELRTLEGHTRAVNAVAVTADGRVVSGSQDNTLKVWDIDTGQAIASFSGDGSFESCEVVKETESVTIVAGDALGRVHFLRLEGG